VIRREGAVLLMTKSVAVPHVKDNISATRTISALFRCCPHPVAPSTRDLMRVTPLHQPRFRQRRAPFCF
jgi:hypothetical protein